MFTFYRVISIISFCVSPLLVGLMIGCISSIIALFDEFNHLLENDDLAIVLMPVVFGPIVGMIIGFFPALLAGLAFVLLERKGRLTQESLTIIIGSSISYYQASNLTGPDTISQYIALIGGLTAFIVGRAINHSNKKKLMVKNNLINHN